MMPISSLLQELRGWLASSIATWKIVIGHHTLRSFGEHGDTVELVQRLLPVLEVSGRTRRPSNQGWLPVQSEGLTQFRTRV